jgi:hypothetical protein
MPFHKALLNGIKDQLAWSRAKREDVGFGLAGVCPHCGHRNNRLLVGWYNEMAGTGKGQWECRICLRRWTWSRKPKAVTA